MRLALLVLAALVGCSEQPQAPAPAPAAPDAEPAPPPLRQFQGERLLAEPPAGWVELYAIDREAFRLVEYVPADSPEEWVEKLSFEALGGAPLPDPIDFLTTMGEDLRATCDSFEDYNAFSGLENEYATSVRLFGCNDNPVSKRGQITLVKAIKGDEFFYTVTWAKRVEPYAADGDSSTNNKPIPEGEMATWSAYMSAITLCNPKTPEHPCPRLKTTPPASTSTH